MVQQQCNEWMIMRRVIIGMGWFGLVELGLMTDQVYPNAYNEVFAT